MSDHKTTSSAFGDKAINKAVMAIVALAKETNVLVAGVPALDGSGAFDVPVNVLAIVADKVAAKKPALAFMIIAAGATHCSMVAHAPSDAFSATDWIIACHVTNSDYGDATRAVGTYECEFPLKAKDELNARAFTFLRAKKALDDDDDSSDNGEDLPPPPFDLNE